MNPRSPKPKWVRRLLPWLTPAAIAGSIAALYHWSEPKKIATNPLLRGASVGVSIHLDNAPFAAYSGGRKTWSLWAKSIDLEHPEYAAAGSFASASLTDIRDGVLYSVSPTEHGSSQPLTSTPQPAQLLSRISSSDSAAPSGPPAVKFHAGSGHYYLGSAQPLPGDLSSSYTARWQLQLSGGVAVTTRDGNSLHTESLTMMELTNLKTHGVEQRLECNAGATVIRKGVKISANRLRYSLSDHTVELLDGVRGSFREGSIQSQRTFWSLNEDTVQIPDASTGILNGNDFAAQSITLDLKNGRQMANHISIYFRTEKGVDTLLGSGRR
jgi:hypothetical protein